MGCSNRGNILQIKTTITWPFNVQQLRAFSFLVIKSTWLHAANIFILTSFLNCSWRRCSVDNRVYVGRRSKIVRIASSPNLRFPFEPSSSALRSRSEQSGSKWTEHNRMSLVTARPTRDMFASHSLILRERLLWENGGNLLLVPYWQIDNHSQNTIMSNRGSDQYQSTQSEQWLFCKTDNSIYIIKLTQDWKISAT